MKNIKRKGKVKQISTNQIGINGNLGHIRNCILKKISIVFHVFHEKFGFLKKGT